MLQERIVQALDQEELRRRIQSNGPKSAERFSIDHCAQELLGFLRQVYEEAQIQEQTARTWMAAS